MQNDLSAMAVLIGVTVLVGALVVAAVRWQKAQRSKRLQQRFGPEYERALADHGSRDRAERALLERQKRRDALDIRPLSEEQCDSFSAEWGRVQQLFVDDPNGAVLAADALVMDVMRARGYPRGEFDQRVADLSVEHGGVVEHYRSARKLAAASEHGRAQTEELRQALVHFRALFADLLVSERPRRPERVGPVASPRLSQV